jgi:hypothetical protein
MRHAVINKKTLEVVNVIIWEGHEIKFPDNWLVIPSEYAEIGDFYDQENQKFIHADRIQPDIA